MLDTRTFENGWGTKVDEVSLDIDYEIIEHFSQHLYGSPNKAIEELVVNGFDAFATWVHVFLPGRYTPEKVVVWDNGTSMGIEELKGLWKIASSPKQKLPGRIARGPRGQTRRLIGKFGIGKLASYTIGDLIAHLCKTDKGFFLVGVDYSDVMSELQEDDQVQNGYTSPIRQLSFGEAKEFVASHFEKLPASFDELFMEPNWTFATISRLKRDDLYQGRLSWVLGNGMPLRPDFKVWVNLERVQSRLERSGLVAEWTLGDDIVREHFSKTWLAAVKEGEVNGKFTFGTEIGLDPARPNTQVDYLELPNLGKVWGQLRLYESSLQSGRSAEHGHSHGFFLMVRGRLLNQEDDKVLLHIPSFRTFYRSQYVLFIDALDDDLLADRERLKEGTPRVQELRVLQRSVYLVTRNKQTDLDQEAEAAALSSYRLPTYSREFFIEPLTSLWMNKGPDDKLNFELQQPEIMRSILGEDGPMAELSSDGRGFSVNSVHPYYATLENQFGTGKRGREVLNEYERLAVFEQLFQGYLFELGLSRTQIAEIARWREDMFRLLAKTARFSIPNLISELNEASYKGQSTFEEAIVAVLEAMGFRAERDGRSGKKDIRLLAPGGTQNTYTLTVEAKGKSKGSLPNDDAEVSEAAAHRDKVGAEHAVIIARKFAGFERAGDQGGPMILQQCRAVGKVSIMETETLAAMLKVMNQYFYPLSTVKDIFTEVETPNEKLARVKKLEKPLEGVFDYRALLDEIWHRQNNEQIAGRDIPYLDIYYSFEDVLEDEDDLDRKIAAIAALAYPLIQHDATKQRVALMQSPEMIASLVQAKLELREAENERDFP